MTNARHKELGSPPFLVDPAALQILLVEKNDPSREKFSKLLQDCNYQVTACETSKEAIDILRAQKRQQGGTGFDLILKDHCPVAGTNACRLLKKAKSEPVLQQIPIVVVSSTEDRDVMVSCLQLGAADYMIKPLRLTELRNLWARVYWWRKASYLMQHSSAPHAQRSSSLRSQQSGGSSLDTRIDGQEGLAREMEERSGEGSAPNEGMENGSRENGSGENGSKGLGSNNASKEGNIGWSRNLAKPGQGTGGEGIGNSAENPGKAPAAVNGAAQLQSKGMKGSDNSTKSRLESSSQATGTAMEDTPFKSTAAQMPGVNGRASQSTMASKHPAPATAGFRAYVSNENRKRSLGSLQTETPKLHTSLSGRALSLDYPPEKMRRTASRLGSGSVLTGPGEATFQNLQRAAAAAADGGYKPASAEAAEQNRPCCDGQPAKMQGLDQGDRQADVNFNPYYPFGVMPNPFTLSHLWGQSNGQPHESDMSQFFARIAQQGQAAAAQSNQQQQLALHNHLMLQHSLIMQQYSMPLNPFANFPGFSNPAASSQEAAQQRPGQTNHTPPQLPLRPQPEAAKSVRSHVNGHPLQPQPHSRHWDPAIQDQKPGASHTWRGNPPTEQNFSSSGKLAEMGPAAGTATGCSFGASGHGPTTGATSHATAQVGLDGCLVEPSQQERRAQALHKYKQKRKNLCFTKKIRYESRKQLAQARPRVKGQFVRVGEAAEVANGLEHASRETLAEDSARVQPYPLDKKPGGTQLLEIVARTDGDRLKDSQSDDDSGDEDVYDEDTDSMSPTRGAALKVKLESAEGNFADPGVRSHPPLPIAQQTCSA